MWVESAVGCFPLILDRIKSNSKRHNNHLLIRTYIFLSLEKRFSYLGKLLAI